MFSTAHPKLIHNRHQFALAAIPTQVVSAKPPFRTVAVLETGPITNHVTFVTNGAGRFAYVTVGGRNVVLAYRRDPGSSPKLAATIKTGDLRRT